MNFRVVGFGWDDFVSSPGAEIKAELVVDECPGYPCRNTLTDASVGEKVVLAHYRHQPNGTHPASGPVYLMPSSPAVHCDPGQVPGRLRSRMLSLRGYDQSGALLDCDLVHGEDFELGVAKLLAVKGMDTVHVHFAKPGCYACLVERVGA